MSGSCIALVRQQSSFLTRPKSAGAGSECVTPTCHPTNQERKLAESPRDLSRTSRAASSVIARLVRTGARGKLGSGPARPDRMQSVARSSHPGGCTTRHVEPGHSTDKVRLVVQIWIWKVRLISASISVDTGDSQNMRRAVVLPRDARTVVPRAQEGLLSLLHWSQLPWATHELP